jgi:predicted HTH domain antitoxin
MNLNIEIPNNDLHNQPLKEEIVKQQIALLMYEKWIWSAAQASKYCELGRLAFQDLLGKNKIAFQMNEEDILNEIKNIMIAK